MFLIHLNPFYSVNSFKLYLLQTDTQTLRQPAAWSGGVQAPSVVDHTGNVLEAGKLSGEDTDASLCYSATPLNPSRGAAPSLRFDFSIPLKKYPYIQMFDTS